MRYRLYKLKVYKLKQTICKLSSRKFVAERFLLVIFMWTCSNFNWNQLYKSSVFAYEIYDSTRCFFRSSWFSHSIDSGLVGSSGGGCRELRKRSRDTYPESYIIRYTSRRRLHLPGTIYHQVYYYTQINRKSTIPYHTMVLPIDR